MNNDVIDLSFREFFVTPVGRRGLEFTEKLVSLQGRRVRLTGFMVHRCDPIPGAFMLAPQPYALHEHEYGLCDDLPPATAFVIVPPSSSDRVVPFKPGPLTMTGTLELGNRPEADGRISLVRLVLAEADAEHLTSCVISTGRSSGDGKTAPTVGRPAACAHGHDAVPAATDRPESSGERSTEE